MSNCTSKIPPGGIFIPPPSIPTTLNPPLWPVRLPVARASSGAQPRHCIYLFIYLSPGRTRSSAPRSHEQWPERPRRRTHRHVHDQHTGREGQTRLVARQHVCRGRRAAPPSGERGPIRPKYRSPFAVASDEWMWAHPESQTEEWKRSRPVTSDSPTPLARQPGPFPSDHEDDENNNNTFTWSGPSVVGKTTRTR
jgi:hypothetical protein